MEKGYLIFTRYLTDGIYKTNSKMKWHERLRIYLAKWLYLSVKKEDSLEIKTTTGSYNYLEIKKDPGVMPESLKGD